MFYNVHYLTLNYINSRELGRKPSEERVSLYVRKPSIDVNASSSESPSDKKTKQFMDSLAARKDVSADFLKTIEEEKAGANRNRSSQAESPAPKKFPLNRTTTPNSLREALRETLVRNVENKDLSDTIQSIKDDEIRDTFDIDSENIETPPIQRRAFRHRSFKLPNGGTGGGKEEEDNVSDIGSDFSGRRKNHKFRTLTGDGKPLGDRELMLKKNAAATDGESKPSEQDDLGSGMFDRFSTARKTLNRGSIRRKVSEEAPPPADDEPLSFEKKASMGDWKTRLASKFKKGGGETYDLEGNLRKSSNEGLERYRRTSNADNDLPLTAPMTEPLRRRNEPISSSMTSTARNGKIVRPKPSSNLSAPRKSSYGDYDSELVDGKYITSVPIISMDDDFSSGNANLRPKHRSKDAGPANKGLSELSRQTSLNRKTSLAERMSSSGTPSTRRATAGGNVFDRLTSNSNSGSKGSLNSSRRSLQSFGNEDADSRRSNGSAFGKMKDLTNAIRRGSRDEDGDDSMVAPMNSHRLFNSGSERKPMSSLNRNESGAGSKSSSTRSLNRTGRDGSGNRTGTPNAVRRATATLGKLLNVAIKLA